MHYRLDRALEFRRNGVRIPSELMEILRFSIPILLILLTLLYPGCDYTSDFGGAGPGLIRAKLKSEFTNKKPTLRIIPNTIYRALHCTQSSESISKAI